MLVDEAARRLARRGRDVWLVGADCGARPGVEWLEPRLRVERWPAWNPLEGRLHVPVPLFAPAALGRLRDLVRRAEVVHVHGALQPLSLWALALARRHRRRALLTEHVGLIQYSNPALNLLQRLVLCAAVRLVRSAPGSGSGLNQVVTVYNRRVGEQLVGYGLPRERLHYIPNGVDLELFRPPRPGERAAIVQALGLGQKPRALFIGRATTRKGLHLFAQARSDRYDRVVVPVRGLAAPVADLDGCIVLPPRPRAELARLYRACDVLALPSHGEGLPVVAQEAMASGLALVLGDDPGYAEYVRPEFARCVPLEPGAIRAAIEQFVASPETRAAAGVQARAWAEAHFAWDTVLDRYEALYRGC